MIRKTVTAAAIALGAAVLVSAPANAVPGYATDRLEVKAGPDYDYPTVAYARSGVRLEITAVCATGPGATCLRRAVAAG